MINNLFSIFDPSFSYLNISWAAIFIPTLILAQFKNKPLTKWTNRIKNIILPIFKEVKPLLGKTIKKGITIILISIFVTLILINIIALAPFFFTPTAHIIISFSRATIIWLSIILFGWLKNTKNIIAHTVPNGTPIALLNFIVLIELVRNIIRPITLSVRLSANIVAGHLLLSLLGNFSLISNFNIVVSSLILIILTRLEIGVALIQAYVFITLITLYSTEVH